MNESPTTPSKRFTWAVFALLVVHVVYFAYRTRACFIDDAYIDLQYLRNLLAGHGFVFHPGGPAVEGVTNVGWLLCLMPFAVVFEPTVAAKLLGLALLLLAFWLTFRLGIRLAAENDQRHRPIAGLAIVPLVLLLSSFDFLYFSLAGMETALLAVVLLSMAWLAMRRPDSLWLPVLGAFAFLVHPEAIVVFPLYTLLVLETARADVNIRPTGSYGRQTVGNCPREPRSGERGYGFDECLLTGLPGGWAKVCHWPYRRPRGLGHVRRHARRGVSSQ